MKLIQASVVLVCFCWVSNGQCAGRMRTLVPVSNSQLVGRSNAASQNSDDILILGGAENAKCETCGRTTCGTTNSCSCNGNKNCGCSFINSEEIIMKLINALIITTVNNNNHPYHPHPHYPHVSPHPHTYGSGGNLIDLGLLQTGGNGGIDALNLGLGSQGVLGVNLGGGGSSAPVKGNCGCSGGSGGLLGSGNDVLNLGVLHGGTSAC